MSAKSTPRVTIVSPKPGMGYEASSSFPHILADRTTPLIVRHPKKGANGGVGGQSILVDDPAYTVDSSVALAGALVDAEVPVNLKFLSPNPRMVE